MTFLPPGSKSLLPNSPVSSLCMLECDVVHRSPSETIREPPEDNEHGHPGLHRSGSREGDAQNEISNGDGLWNGTVICDVHSQTLGTETGRTVCFGHLLRTRLVNNMVLWEEIRSLGSSGSSEGPWLDLPSKAAQPTSCPGPVSPRNRFLHIRSLALTSQTLHQS